MNKYKNPFRPAFGSIPLALAGREQIVNDILVGLDNAPGDPNRATIFVGGRGTGKTVLLAKIAELAEEKGWVGVNVTSGPNILDDIIIETVRKAGHLISPKTRKQIAGFSVAGVSVDFENKDEKTNWRREMTDVLEELNANGTGLLITVDEVSVEDEGLKILIDNFQHFVRERRDVAVLLAGLPGNVSQMLTDRKISFLRRAFKREMESISTTEVAYAMKQTISLGGRTIGDEALWAAAEKTEGFAFLIQLLGYHMWRQSPDEEEISLSDVGSALSFAMKDMREMMFEVTMNELTDREKMFVSAMSVDDGVSEIIEVSDRMGISPNNAVKIRKRLIERGVISSAGRGRVKLEMPMMLEYLRSAETGK